MDNQLKEFCTITGANEEAARGYLEASEHDLQTAIELYFADSSLHDGTPTTSANETIRAPIPQSSAQLVAEPFQASYAPVRQYRSRDSVFDRFRDFQAETVENEARIRAAARKINNGEHDSDDDVIIDGESRAEKSNQPPENKKRTLESLFRPPLEIMHRGNFETAKHEACESKKWLLVNIQNVTEFACQSLNRDIWNHQMVRDLIAGSFVLWQIYYDSADGNRFCTYYPVESYPFICIIDPITGELVKTLRRFSDTMSFCDSVISFLDEHPILSNEPSTRPKMKNLKISDQPDKNMTFKRKAADIITDEEDKPSCSTQKFSKSEKSTSRTMNGHFISNGHKIQEENVNWKSYSSNSGAELQLLFKLPEGERQTLKIKAKSLLKAVIFYAQQELKMPFDRFSFVLDHPRRQLNLEDFEKSLEELNFNNQEVVYIEEK